MEPSNSIISTMIEDNITRAAFPRNSMAQFIPRVVLNSITYTTIIQYFQHPDNGSHHLDGILIGYIFNCLRELFAIFIAVSMPANEIIRLVEALQKQGVTDNDIPRIDEILAKLPSTLRLGRFSKNNVGNHRYMFKAPEFLQQYRTRFIDLHPRIPLPIESCGEKSWSGGFGTVYQIKIHPRFDEKSADERSPCAAIKEFAQGGDPKAWQREVTALQKIGYRKLSHVVDAKAIFTQSAKIYLIFPWANGGNLVDFWKQNDDYNCRVRIAQGVALHILKQLEGLSLSLAILHDFNGNGIASYRHGDLKPENILLFISQNGPDAFPGIWKMSDLGLAKLHEVTTGHRYDMQATSLRPFGTTSYKPPEAWTHSDEPTSRLFDVWSMGCIILELITWLVYGMNGVEELTRNTGWLEKRSCYWLGQYAHSQGWFGLTIHPYVTNLINKLRTDLLESPALRELIEVVETKLLVIDLPPPGKPGVYRYRTDALGLYKSLQIIRQKCEWDSSNWSSSWKAIRRSSAQTTSEGLMGNTPQMNIYDHPFYDKWSYRIDNVFPDVLFHDNKSLNTTTSASKRLANLCASCKQLDFGEPEFRVRDTHAELQARAGSCCFCNLRLKICKFNLSNPSSIVFDRIDSNLYLGGRYPPVLTIHQAQASNDPERIRGLQIGLPQLPGAGTSAHFDILRHWLLECDQNQTSCWLPESISTAPPTRLIDVGSNNSPFVRLHETQQHDSGRYTYLALSHPWGPQRSKHFCTSRQNLAEHIEGIEVDTLPATFRDAIKVTRSLGHRYLWIDSICIVQGPDGDFNHEAKRMEDVYSQAYCVLVASAACGQHDGFLRDRKARNYITFRRDPSPAIYICEFIDDFQADVLGSHLSTRGWAFQERVLAKRTIYFTEKQTYWECGHGVRCETMTTMHNEMESSLGDPNFPAVAMAANRGGKIQLYQSLYSRYSRLDFSNFEDRPVAIAGLEQRLISRLDLRGGFGMLDDDAEPNLLRRSLLWRRAEDEAQLDLIDFSGGSDGSSSIAPPPTWSWMAYKGAIGYLDIPFGQVVWETEDIVSPWSTSRRGTWSYSRDISDEPRKLKVVARDFDKAGVAASLAKGTAYIVVDTPLLLRLQDDTLKCVILGRLRGGAGDTINDTRHFVMLVRPTTGPETNCHTYVRVGVGYMPGDVIRFERSGTVGHVL